MNCKQGDLAVVVNSRLPKSENIGRFVKVLRPASDYVDPVTGKPYLGNGFCWLVEAADGEPLTVYVHPRKASDDPYKVWGYRTVRPMRDTELRPIRPPAQRQQIKSSASKPEKVAA
jgi:hypothetical protein